MHNALKTIIMACLVAFPALARASYPDVITDPTLRGVIDYEDLKIDFALNQSSFSDVTATTTFSGYIDIGLVRVNANGTQIADAICPSGTYILSGGGTSNAACGQYNSYPLNNTTWRSQCGSAMSMTSYAICARVKPFP